MKSRGSSAQYTEQQRKHKTRTNQNQLTKQRTNIGVETIQPQILQQPQQGLIGTKQYNIKQNSHNTHPPSEIIFVI